MAGHAPEQVHVAHTAPARQDHPVHRKHETAAEGLLPGTDDPTHTTLQRPTEELHR